MADEALASPPRAHLMKLPMEIMEHIADLCWVLENFDTQAIVPRLLLPPFDGDELRAGDSLGLRLVCREVTAKVFRSFAEAFFSDLTAIMTLKILQRLVDVSRHEQLSKVARRLTVGQHLLVPIANLTSRHEPDYFDNPVMLRILGKEPDVRLPWRYEILAETRRSVDNYGTVVDEQQALADNEVDVAMLAAAISQLRNLRAAGVADDFCEDGTRISMSHWGLKDLTQALCIQHPVRITTPISGNAAFDNLTVIVSKLILALALYKCRHPRANIVSLDLHPSGPVGIEKTEGPGLHLQKLATAFPTRAYEFATLRRLDLTVYSHVDMGNANEVLRDTENAMGVLRSLLIKSLHCIKKLGLYFSDHPSGDASSSVSSALCTNVLAGDFVRLRAFPLTGSTYVSTRELAMFIGRHSKTLQDVCLQLFEDESALDYGLDLSRQASQCEQLERFDLYTFHSITEGGIWQMGNHSFEWTTRKAVAAGLSKLLEEMEREVSPRRRPW